MRITPHFTLEELIKTSQPYTNMPSMSAAVNLCALAFYILEPLRLHVNEPVIITSGFRCPEVNKAVGGVSNSQHLSGCAADIRVSSEADAKRKFAFLRSLYYTDQLLYEKSTSGTRWLHVSFSWEPRHLFNDNYRA